MGKIKNSSDTSLAINYDKLIHRVKVDFVEGIRPIIEKFSDFTITEENALIITKLAYYHILESVSKDFYTVNNCIRPLQFKNYQSNIDGEETDERDARIETVVKNALSAYTRYERYFDGGVKVNFEELEDLTQVITVYGTIQNFICKAIVQKMFFESMYANDRLDRLIRKSYSISYIWVTMYMLDVALGYIEHPYEMSFNLKMINESFPDTPFDKDALYNLIKFCSQKIVQDRESYIYYNAKINDTHFLSIQTSYIIQNVINICVYEGVEGYGQIVYTSERKDNIYSLSFKNRILYELNNTKRIG